MKKWRKYSKIIRIRVQLGFIRIVLSMALSAFILVVSARSVHDVACEFECAVKMLLPIALSRVISSTLLLFCSPQNSKFTSHEQGS